MKRQPWAALTWALVAFLHLASAQAVDDAGRKLEISGYEEWTIGADGLVAASFGHFDAADYDRQLGKAP